MVLYPNKLPESERVCSGICRNEQVACEKVKQKYFTEWCKKDIYFFLGTTKKFHNVGTNPFIIIGTFYPPKNPQLTLTFKMD